MATKKIRDAAGKVIAEIWRYPRQRDFKRFGMRVEGVLWRDGKPTLRSGLTTKSYQRQRDALAELPAALEVARQRPQT